MNAEYRINLSIKNNLILKKIEESGYLNVNAFCLAFNISASKIGEIINLKSSPFRSDGNWKKVILKVCEALRCSPEDLFTEIQMNNVLFENKKQIQINESYMVEYMARIEKFESVGDPEISLISHEKNKFLDEAINSLSSRSGKVIKLRIDGLSLRECGDVIGVTPERIRQIEAKSYRSIRGFYIKNKGGDLV